MGAGWKAPLSTDSSCLLFLKILETRFYFTAQACLELIVLQSLRSQACVPLCPIFCFLSYLFLFIHFYFVCMSALPTCMDMHSVCVPGAQGGQVLDALKPELEMFMDYVDAED